jgi:hypothetical protein
MIDYLSSLVYTNGLAFPNTLAVNASGGAAVDGTEFVKLLVDDHWGARQALMARAGLTPNGITEAPGNSQFIESIQKAFGIGPGAKVTWYGNNDPAVDGYRILLTRGQGVLIANYQDLDNIVYVGDANNAAVAGAGGAFYHASDAGGTTPDIAGPYLILPDTRGTVTRDEDSGATVDPDGATRKLGGFQADAAQKITGEWEHQANVGAVRDGSGFTNGVFTAGASNTSTPNVLAASSKNVAFDNSLSTSPNPSKTDDFETRMANTQGKFGIVY